MACMWKGLYMINLFHLYSMIHCMLSSNTSSSCGLTQGEVKHLQFQYFDFCFGLLKKKLVCFLAKKETSA